jgi:predicted nucleic-acid-binding protein
MTQGPAAQARRFVDTNVFLRFLTWDHPEKAKKAESLFTRAVEGKLTLITSLLVMAEIVWTLESFYGLEKPDIAEKVRKILNTPHLECPEAELILQALDLYATKNIDFIDAYHAFWLRGQSLSHIVTYDRKHFGRVPWLKIMEP